MADTVKASEIGRRGNKFWTFIACPECGTQRWVPLHGGKTKYVLCAKCSQSWQKDKYSSDNSKMWRGGRIVNDRGYVLIYVDDDDEFACMRMAGKHYVYEHRLVVAKHLGRPLKSHEIIHHVNRVKDDNRIENLEMMDRHEHAITHKWRKFT